MRIWYSLSIVAAAALLTLLVLKPVETFDVWWHLHSGLWMLDNLRVLQEDLWSFTSLGDPWRNVSWLFQVLLAGAYRAGGEWGLLLFKATGIFLVFTIIGRATGTIRNVLPLVVAALVMLPVFHENWHLRPNIMELIALASVVLLSQYRWRRRHAVFAFLLLLFWANSHASVFIGAIALALQCLFGAWSEETRLPEKVLFAAAILATPLLTPLGMDLVYLMFDQKGGMSIYRYYVSEWAPSEVYPPRLWLSFAVVLLAALNRRIRIQPAEWLLLLFFLYYSTQSVRFELEFALLLLRPLAGVIGLGVNALGERRAALPVLASLLLVALTLLVTPDNRGIFAYRMDAEIPVKKFHYPSVTAAQLADLSEQLGRPVHVLNEYDFGGYLPFVTGGAARVFVDGRMTRLFPDAYLVPRYRSDLDVLERMARRYRVDAILLRTRDSGVLPPDHPEWQTIGYDTASVLYARRDLVRELGLPDIGYEPAVYSNDYPAQAIVAYRTLTREFLERYPDNPAAFIHLALFSSAERSTPEGRQRILGLFRRAARANPEDIPNRATLAYLMTLWSEYPDVSTDDFLDILPRADEMDPEVRPEHQFGIARYLARLGFYDMALEYLYPEEEVRRWELDALLETWALRATYHARAKDTATALAALEVAFELLDTENPGQVSRLEQVSAEIRKLLPAQ